MPPPQKVWAFSLGMAQSAFCQVPPSLMLLLRILLPVLPRPYSQKTPPQSHTRDAPRTISPASTGQNPLTTSRQRRASCMAQPLQSHTRRDRPQHRPARQQAQLAATTGARPPAPREHISKHPAPGDCRHWRRPLRAHPHRGRKAGASSQTKATAAEPVRQIGPEACCRQSH